METQSQHLRSVRQGFSFWPAGETQLGVELEVLPGDASSTVEHDLQLGPDDEGLLLGPGQAGGGEDEGRGEEGGEKYYC